MGLIFCVASWFITAAFSLFYFITNIPSQDVIIMITIETVGLFLAAFFFLKKQNVYANLILSVSSFVGVIFASNFPVVGPYINLFLCSVAIFPVILLDHRNLAFMLVNLIGCVLILTWTELYQKIATSPDITEQVFGFLAKCTLIFFGFGQAYAIRVLFEPRLPKDFR